MPAGQPGAPGNLAGDCNRNDTVDLGDSACLFGFPFVDGGTNHLPCDGGELGNVDPVILLDWNGDESSSISGKIGLLDYLFLGGTPHTPGVDGCVILSRCPEVCTD